jgi:aspartyl-tRNA(Asn)/glutamyl-tRNA(Gln) amidotransferase subunit A
VSIFITPAGGVAAPPGRRLAVKDLFDTAGVRTTYGSAIFRDHVPSASAEAVVRLERAGYVSVGKSNLHEFAWGITSENPHFGTVPNPLAPGRVAGGSSGGNAAALAADLCDVALGTDSGGSIRIPAACCGVVGFKPTHGLVPMEGCWPLARSYDHGGPMARDVAGCAEMMEALVPGFGSATVSSLADLRVGVAWTERAAPLVAARVGEAATLAGARPVELPEPIGVYATFNREAAEVHATLFAEHRALYGNDVATKLDFALKVTDAEVAEAARALERYRDAFAAAMEPFDVVLAPTLPFVAPRVGVGDLALRKDMISLTFPFNAAGAPALALPCGPAEAGLPASLQLVGRPGEDTLVLAAGALLERELVNRSGRPPAAAPRPRRDPAAS